MMDPYPHIKAKYPGDQSAIARELPHLPHDDLYRVANDLRWLIGEVGGLRDKYSAVLALLGGLIAQVDQHYPNGELHPHLMAVIDVLRDAN